MSQRFLQPELMDDLRLPSDQLKRALHELSLINRWLGGHRTSRLGVQTLLQHVPNGQQISILDVAAGGTGLGDVLNVRGRSLDIAAFDLNPLSLSSGRNPQAVKHRVVGSAHQLPFADSSFDIVHISLFLHHCTDDEALALLRSALRIARVGVVVNELHRHFLAFAAIFALTRMFSRSHVVRHDAIVSVRRAFTRKELQTFTSSLDATVERLTWQWAFRWNLCLRRGGSTDHG